MPWFLSGKGWQLHNSHAAHEKTDLCAAHKVLLACSTQSLTHVLLISVQYVQHKEYGSLAARRVSHMSFDWVTWQKLKNKYMFSTCECQFRFELYRVMLLSVLCMPHYSPPGQWWGRGGDLNYAHFKCTTYWACHSEPSPHSKDGAKDEGFYHWSFNYSTFIWWGVKRGANLSTKIGQILHFFLYILQERGSGV